MEKKILINNNSLKDSNSFKKLRKNFKENYDLYLFIVPAVLYFLIFHYGAMVGVVLAFKKYIAVEGIWGSPWVGFEYFEKFFTSYQFIQLLKNTLGLSIYRLIAGFPMPIILALMMNNIINKRYKKLVQTITYAPHFISVVVLVGILNVFLSPSTGLVNNIIEIFGGEPKFFMGESSWFKTLFVFSDVWQNVGWGSIIYLAALSGVDPTLHEAAIVDGATKLQRVFHIDLPSLKPTIIILLILNIGQIMNIGFEKVLLMQNHLNIETSQVISTYVYQVGLVNYQYSYATAIGLFNNVINCLLLISVNYISRRYSENSLW